MTLAPAAASLEQFAEVLNVTVRHDERVPVWYVDESELPGLHAEAETLDELVEIIEDLAPDLAANLSDGEGGRTPSRPICIRHFVGFKRAHAP